MAEAKNKTRQEAVARAPEDGRSPRQAEEGNPSMDEQVALATAREIRAI